MSDPTPTTPAPVEQPVPEAAPAPAPKRIDLKALLRPIPPSELEAP